MSGRVGIGVTLWSLAAVIGTAGLSRVSWSPQGEDGRLRLSWRIADAAQEVCRAPTDEELAGLPVHMRPQSVCETRSAVYRLRVEIDGVELLDERIEGSGLRRDRPVYVFEEFPVTPGRHQVRVWFGSEGGLGDPSVLDLPLSVAERETLLITTSGDSSGLVTKTGRGGAMPPDSEIRP